MQCGVHVHVYTSIQPYRYSPIMDKNNHKLVYDVGFVIYCVLLSRCCSIINRYNIGAQLYVV